MSLGYGPAVVQLGGYELLLDTRLPALLAEYRREAQLAEHFELEGEPAAPAGDSFLAVRRLQLDWPDLVVTQRFAPAGFSFSVGALVVPETDTVLVGAGSRLLGYGLRSGRWTRLFVDEADVGFWVWRRHGDVVLMCAELELAAWSADGAKLWSTYVEPPWTYRVEGFGIELHAAGTRRSFELARGPGV